MNVVLFLTLTVSSLAVAQAVPTVGASGTEEASKVPYRGTSVSYGHSMSVYNYTEEERVWTHRLGLTPEWHFSDAIAVRARLYLTQELTLGTTTTPREVEFSDLWLDAVWGGWKEKITGLKVAADLRATFPTSKQSRAASRLFTLGPGANVSRTFNVLSGLTFVYSARFTWRFNRFSTRQNQGGLISNCGIGNPEACTDTNTGANNVQYDVIHGPTVVFNPHQRLNIAASLFMQRGWILPHSEGVTTSGVPYEATAAQTKDFIGFSFGVTYQPWDFVGFTLGAFTFANQLTSEGTTIVPFFNRNTAASLDASFDLEAIVAGLTKEKK